MEKSIQDVISQAKKFHLEREELVKKTDELRAQLTIQEIRRDALFAQLKASKEELKKLRIKAVSLYYYISVIVMLPCRKTFVRFKARTILEQRGMSCACLTISVSFLTFTRVRKRKTHYPHIPHDSPRHYIVFLTILNV